MHARQGTCARRRRLAKHVCPLGYPEHVRFAHTVPVSPFGPGDPASPGRDGLRECKLRERAKGESIL